MKTTFFSPFVHVVSPALIVLLSGMISAQSPYPNQPGYPATYQPMPPVYMANRDMSPNAPTKPSQIPLTESEKKLAAESDAKPSENKFTAFWKKTFSGSKSTEKDVPLDLNAQEEVADKESKPSFWAKMFPPAKDKDVVDNGQDEIDAIAKERSFSEKDYFDSATREKNTAAKDFYSRGMQQEATGNFPAAVHSYNAFIKANKKQTTNGTLAAPYHRLALISWKQSEAKNADVYFRYAMKYAMGGNIAVIAGDYSLYLLEQGETERAEVILRNTLLYFPEDKRLQISLGRCMVRQNKPVEAVRYLTDAMGEDRAYQEIALIYQQQGDYASARAMNRKRDEYLARTNRGPIGSYQYQYVQNMPGQGVPTAPPVMPNARGMQSQATLVYPMPFPTLDRSGDAPQQVGSNQPSGNSGYFVPPTLNTPAAVGPAAPETKTGTEGINPAAATPVSKVFHYPSGCPTPVYHQYTGDQYPRSMPGSHASDLSKKEYYMISTVPTVTPADSTGNRMEPTAQAFGVTAPLQ